MTEKNILPACSVTVSIPVTLWRFNMAFDVLLSIARPQPYHWERPQTAY